MSILRVFNDLLLSDDSGDSAVLILLDVTVTSTPVDHNVLISGPDHSVAIKSISLEWFKSDLSFPPHPT